MRLMRVPSRLAALTLVSLLSAGCYQQTFTNNTLAPTAQEESSRKVFGLFGLIGDPTIDTSTMCKEGVRSVVWKADPLDVIVSTLTLGLVSLRSVSIECGRAVPQGARP
jgi:hypothetical protein